MTVLFYILLGIFLFRFLKLVIGTYSGAGTIPPGTGGHRQHQGHYENKRPGETRVTYRPENSTSKNSSSGDDEGEYIDYQEIK